MSWRTLVITKRSKLEYKLGYLVVRTDEIKRIHITEISVLIIEDTSIALTAALLYELSKHKVKVIFCDEKRNPYGELVAYYGSHDTSLKYRDQINWSQTSKELVWTQIITEKIKCQRDHLAKYKMKESSLLNQYLEEIEINDISNREGHAAKVYFNALFGKGFSRSDDNAINASLNYGYAILLSQFNKMIVSTGYFTQLGISHCNMFNPFNLASDLMEPFRIIVDEKVKKMNIIKFDQVAKYDLIDLMNKSVDINGKSQYVSNAIAIYSRSVFDALQQNDVSLIRFYKNEL